MKSLFIILVCGITLSLTGCGIHVTKEDIQSIENRILNEKDGNDTKDESLITEEVSDKDSEETVQSESSQAGDVLEDSFSAADYLVSNGLPEYDGENPYTVINNNTPFFTGNELTTDEFEYYSELDELGRCGTAFANISPFTMPDEERGQIGDIRPSGWHTVKYDFLEDLYLFNRCHLIGFQLAGENDNVLNLVTGTRYLNVVGMLPFENEVYSYVAGSGKHVAFRVTPVFVDDELICRGILMEACSVEDDGADVRFCVYCHNVQPGVDIDYRTGDSSENSSADEIRAQIQASNSQSETAGEDPFPDNGVVIEADTTYVFNTNSHKFHEVTCDSVKDISERNLYQFKGTREEAIDDGYVPCKRCNP